MSGGASTQRTWRWDALHGTILFAALSILDFLPLDHEMRKWMAHDIGVLENVNHGDIDSMRDVSQDIYSQSFQVITICLNQRGAFKMQVWLPVLQDHQVMLAYALRYLRENS